MKRKILFIVAHRKDRSPGQRFRLEQYLSALEESGFEITFSYLLSAKDDQIFYSHGHYFQKLLIIIRCILKRINDVRNAKKYDIIFIFREAFMIGSSFFERIFAKKSKIIFDFDDSIWLPNVSNANKKFKWIKKSSKTSNIIKFSDLVFAGNKYLYDYAVCHNTYTVIVPTTINTEEYRVHEVKKQNYICIGWSGSITTIQHFKIAEPFLLKIKEKYGEKVVFKVIGDSNYKNEALEIRGISWSKENEIKELLSFDIGIMPLPDDEWSKGKCGLKGLQYMSLEIPTIMSPVGVNNEIINDGVNGFLASSEEEWINKLSRLIDDAELRKNMGSAGRQTVVEKYSVDAHKKQYVQYFLNLMEIKKA